MKKLKNTESAQLWTNGRGARERGLTTQSWALAAFRETQLGTCGYFTILYDFAKARS